MDRKRGLGFWILISIGILLILMFLLGQTLSLIDYDLTVSLGLQESEEEITKVGVAFAKGFAFGDTVFYIPLFVIGIVGLLKRKSVLNGWCSGSLNLLAERSSIRNFCWERCYESYA
jgi:hypothetical protein